MAPHYCTHTYTHIHTHMHIHTHTHTHTHTQITVGGDIPPEYYMTNLTETSKENMESVVVSRGSSYEREFIVEVPGTVIR